jgi:hypothetical protein
MEADITCINMLQLGRDSFFHFCKVFRDRGLLEDTIHVYRGESSSVSKYSGTQP